jgi:uncharacterized membrane protein YvlD (DUF360 family)
VRYIKSLLFNFLVVFFADHILPGIEVMDQTKLPHIGGDLLFSIGLGFLNSLIFPCLRLLDRQLTAMRVATIALVLNFAAYALLRLLPVGIQVMTVEGYIVTAIVVSCGSFITNYLELKHHRTKEPPKVDFGSFGKT